MFAVKAKIYGVIYNQSSSTAFDETSSYWSAPKKTDLSGPYLVHLCTDFVSNLAQFFSLRSAFDTFVWVG